MREQLVTSVPQARALDGTAESIPLPDASVDAVLVAEAWHWVETRRAIPEVARVLVPGWVLGLAWNVNDEGDDWSAQLGRTVRRRRSTRGPARWRSDQTCSAYRRASPPAPWQHQLVVTSAGTVSGSEAEADETGLGCGREYFLIGGLPVAGESQYQALGGLGTCAIDELAQDSGDLVALLDERMLGIQPSWEDMARTVPGSQSN
jgi:SAM-dependent methyltransferase